MVDRNVVSRMSCAAAGISVYGGENVIALNRVEYSTFDGSEPAAVTVRWHANTVSGNYVHANGACGPPVAGIFVKGDDAIIAENRSHGNHGPGVVLDGGEGMTVVQNWALRNAPGDGFVVSASDSLFDRNRADYNEGFGIRDTTSGGGTRGTANTYLNNRCTGNRLGKSLPTGLCK